MLGTPSSSTTCVQAFNLTTSPWVTAVSNKPFMSKFAKTFPVAHRSEFSRLRSQSSVANRGIVDNCILASVRTLSTVLFSPDALKKLES